MNILTENAITELATFEIGQSASRNYLVQILGLKLVEPHRYMALISDGTHSMRGIMAKKFTSLVATGQIQKYSVIRLTEVSMNGVGPRTMLVILELEVLPNYPLTRIGNPCSIEHTESFGQNTQRTIQGQQPLQHIEQSSPHHIQPQASQQIQQPVQQIGTAQAEQFTPQHMQQQPIHQLQQPVRQIERPPPLRVQQPLIHQPQQPFRQIGPFDHQLEQSTSQSMQQQHVQQLGRPIHQTTHPSQQSPFAQNIGSSYSSELSNQHLESSLLTVNGLNPYRNKWTIKARVVQKSDVKTWSNPRSEGKLFSVNFLDNTGEIKATAFQREVDQFYSLLEEGQVYYISNARVVMAKKQFSTLNNQYELTLDYGTQVVRCDDDSSIPEMKYSFTKIADIASKGKNDTTDVIGVVRKDKGLEEIINKANGAPIKKRELSIVDETQKEIRVSIWGRTAELFDSSGFPVAAFKGVKVQDFGGRTLSLQNSGVVKTNPNIPETQELLRWFNDHGQQAVYSNFTNTLSTSDGFQASDFTRMTIADAKHTYRLGEHETVSFFETRGTIMYIKTDCFCYPACPECSKKMTLEETSWRCEKCSMVHSAPKYKYVLSFSIEDDTAHLYATAFDKVAEQLLHKSATEMTRLVESFGYTYLHDSLFDLPKYKPYIFKIKAEQRVYNDFPSTKYVALEATPVDFVKESGRLVGLIDALMYSSGL